MRDRERLSSALLDQQDGDVGVGQSVDVFEQQLVGELRRESGPVEACGLIAAGEGKGVAAPVLRDLECHALLGDTKAAFRVY